MFIWTNYLMHHGIKGMSWGIRLGPPYPLSKQASGIQSLVTNLKNIKYKEFDSLMHPNEVAEKKRGSCHDQVMYEMAELKKLGIMPKAHFFIEANKKGQGGATHSLVYFNLSGKTYWLENAWGAQKGLHAYANENTMLKDHTKKMGKE